MRKVTIFFLTATAIGIFSLTSCTKNNTTTVKTPDSVYSSNWVTLSMLPNLVDSDFEQNISAPAITSAILDHGVILGYGAFLNASQDTVVENALEFDMFQTVSVGNILLQSGFNNTGLWYRYVIVPGNVLTTKGLTPLQAKSLSYAEVTKLIASTAGKAKSPTIQ